MAEQRPLDPTERAELVRLRSENIHCRCKSRLQKAATWFASDKQ